MPRLVRASTTPFKDSVRFARHMVSTIALVKPAPHLLVAIVITLCVEASRSNQTDVHIFRRVNGHFAWQFLELSCIHLVNSSNMWQQPCRHDCRIAFNSSLDTFIQHAECGLGYKIQQCQCSRHVHWGPVATTYMCAPALTDVVQRMRELLVLLSENLRELHQLRDASVPAKCLEGKLVAVVTFCHWW